MADFNFEEFFSCVASQNAEKLKTFFEPDAVIVWPNSSEFFTVENYIRANCDYPGKWKGELENLIPLDSLKDVDEFIAIVKVWNKTGETARSVTFLHITKTSKLLIRQMVEFWGDVGEPPAWRRAKHLMS